MSTYLVPCALSEVRQQWPKLRFAVTVGMCPAITNGLSNARYDVGLMLQTANRSSANPATADDGPARRAGVLVLAKYR